MTDRTATDARGPLARWTLGHALHPSTLILLGGNALPLIGIVWWGWDAFQVLILYWLETAVVGFWALVRIALRPQEATGGTAGRKPGMAARLATLTFFVFHAGLFMGVHFAILWTEFAGDWHARITGPSSFLAVLVWGSGLWIGLAFLFVSHGLTCLRELADLAPLRRAVLRLWPDYPGPVLAPKPFVPGDAIIGFYGRIVLMQVALLAGAFAAVKLGAEGDRVMWPLVILITIKTYVEFSLQMAALADEKQG